MKVSLRFLLPLLAILAGMMIAFVLLLDSIYARWFLRDLDRRSFLVGNALVESVSQALANEAPDREKRLKRLLASASRDDRLLATAICLADGQFLARTDAFPEGVICPREAPPEPSSEIRRQNNRRIHIMQIPFDEDSPPRKTLLLVHDTQFVERRSDDTRLVIVLLFGTLSLLVAAATVVVSRWSVRGWVRNVREMLSKARIGEFPDKGQDREFLPIVRDVRALLRELDERTPAFDSDQGAWDARKLKDVLGEQLSAARVVVVSNREPYIHNRTADGQVQVLFPASGLVTAMEPIVRACSGVWVAHGSGSADRDVVDAQDHVPVPPDDPSYTLRRVWLTREEEEGYYYGFSNEGLWPLCHMAHVRPMFRHTDWQRYCEVNQRFADAVVQEAGVPDPVVLLQDYHLALAPRLIRERLPKATIITFWHIPWPNPESFGICPWRKEILNGLLGSSILGFHTQFHCNNFIDTMDRFLECRIDRETATILRKGKPTLVRPYPISIEYPSRPARGLPSEALCREAMRREFGIPEGVQLGIGIDRLDYTKGIVERFLSVEHLFERHPEWIGKFTFVQVAAPSRSELPAYQNFEREVRQTAEKINEKLGKGDWKPIVLEAKHHGPESVSLYYRAADVCFVSSLHDGMNLVAKEYIAAREKESGTLILSMFAGASRELTEALIVNPYDIVQCADELHHALSMTPAEQRDRMWSMKRVVSQFNVYRWAGKMLLDAAAMRRKHRLLERLSTGSES